MTLPPVAPKPDLHVRPATAHDIGFLTDVVLVTTRAQGRLPDDFDEDVYRSDFAEWTAEQVAGLVERSTLSVIEIDGERAGRLRVVRGPDFMELAGIQLLPSHQGHGLGTYLIEEFIAKARDAGLPARVSVEKDNPRARALYERLGFVVVSQSGNGIHLEAR